MAVLKNTKSRDLIQEMWDHEKAHLAKFEELLVEYQVSFKGSKTTLSLKWKCQIYQAVLAGTTNSADSSLEACGVHLGGGLLLAGGEGGNGLHSCGGWRYISSIRILFKFCISENLGCKRERFYFLAQVEALVTKHYDDQVTEMVENNPRLDENLIEVIKNIFFHICHALIM